MMKAEKTININGSLLSLSTPLVMGILNVTPNSFYHNSRKQSDEDIVNRCRDILQDGGAIIDVGAQSTSPSSKFLSAKEEADRLMPALKLIRKEFPNAIISVDTFYADIAKESVRSEERRVGKECRSRWSPDQYKEKNESADCVSQR